MKEAALVILAGGIGERFWPLSRSRFPKQLLPLLSGKSLLQLAVERVRGLVGDTRLFVVAGKEYSEAVRQQLPMLPPENLIVEPESRNTAPAIGLAALILQKRFPGDPAVVFLPSDLYVAETEAYREFLKAVTGCCMDSGQPVIAGTAPARPEPGFGYIHAGKKLGTVSGFDCRAIIAFKEKPDLKTAASYLASGHYFWNAGVFAWRLSALVADYQTHLPLLLDGLRQYVELPGGALPVQREFYGRLSKVSFDEGILEPIAEQLIVMIGDYEWRDLGNWNAWAEFWPGDPEGNRIQGRHFGVDTKECLIYSPSKPVVTFGISNLLIVEAGDVLLVCDRNQAQDIKKLVNRLRELGELELL